MITSHRKLLLVLSTLALASMACGLSAVALLAPATPTPTPPTLFSLATDSVETGLDALDRYQTSLTLDFEGERNGQLSAGHIEQTAKIDRPGHARRHSQTIEAVIPNRKSAANHIEFLQAGATIFVRQDDDVFWFEPRPNQQVSPQDFGVLPLESLLILPETVTTAPRFDTVEGVNSQQYQFTEKNLSSPDITFDRAAGTVWVAIPGNTVVRYEISGTVRAADPATTAHLLDEGTLRLSYRLERIAGPLHIEPPPLREVVPGPLADLPRLPNSEMVAAYPTLLEYSSVISPVSATLYYQTKLSELGWTETITSVFNEKARLAFARNNERVTILITPADQPPKTKIVISLDEQR